VSITIGKTSTQVDIKMLMHKSSIRIGVLLSALVGFLPAAPALADSPRVTAVLSNSQVSVGQTVQMQIRVTGAKEASTPSEINVDGLEIHQTGTSRQVEMHNFDITSSVTYSYTILPLKAGAFTIPPQTIRLGSTSLQTPELRLAVVGSGGAPTGRSPGNSATQNAQVAPGKIAFAELLVPKKTAYVGEMIPIVIRLGFFTSARIVEPPDVAVQGFTTQKLQAPDEPQTQNIGGRECQVISFKTAIAATRAGKFEIGPIRAVADITVPRQQESRSRRRSPFDVFNMDDPFLDPFLANPFRGSVERRTIATETASLEIKPLPGAAPPGFSGAIGSFTLTADANPKSVQLGDPITVTAAIAGRGNFDRVNAPALEDERGWHKYPPSAKFKQDDNVGISGDKTFEMVISPNEKKQAIPPLLFSYFDPLKEQYVTLKSAPIPVRAEGGIAPAPTPAMSAPPAPSSTPPAATPAPAPAQQDILYQLTDRPARAQSFAPLYMRPTFWAAQLLPLLALLGFIGWKVRQARMQDREARRTAALQHEAADLIRALRNDGTSPQEYYTRASRAIRVKTALAMKIDPNIVDAEAVAAAFHLDEASREQLQRLFERSDEVKYSGAPNGTQSLPPEQRRATLALIESLRS
jgi:hypothetical protein